MSKSEMKISDCPIDSLSEDSKKRIDAFLEKSDYATIFHTTRWNSILPRIFLDKSLEFRMVYVEEGDEILGCCPIVTRKTSGRSQHIFSPYSQFEMPYGGPISIEGKNNLLKEMLDKLDNFSPSKVDIFTSPRMDISIFEDYGYKVSELETTVIDLQQQDETLWNSFNRNTKRNIRKAEKNKLNVIEIDKIDNNILNQYYNFVKSTLTGKVKFVKPIEFYQEVFTSLIPKNARFLMVENQGQFVGGGIFLIFRDTVYNWHVGISKENLSMGSNYILIWEMIKWSKKNGYKKFDFVRIERERLPQIARFKLGWGGKIVPFYHLQKSKLFYRLGKYLKSGVRRILNKSV